MNNKEKLNAFKQTVIENCNNKDFVYNEFFVNDHLLITEKIALELIERGSTAINTAENAKRLPVSRRQKQFTMQLQPTPATF